MFHCYELEHNLTFLLEEKIMAIPDFQTIMLPLLQHIGDGQEYSNREITEALADYL